MNFTKEQPSNVFVKHATGLVVAPGFIDSHDQSMDLFAAKMGLTGLLNH